MRFASTARVAAMAVACISVTTIQAEAERARSAASFVDSVGICTHFGYPDTPYGSDFEGVRRRLAELGIHHVRDGFTDRIVTLARMGIKTCVVAEPEAGTPEQIKDKIKAVNALAPAIDVVEGPNEPDLFWVNRGKSYNGKNASKSTEEMVDAVTAFQRDLYTAIKGDPATAGLTVIGPALGKTYDPGGVKNPFGTNSLASFIDWGNFHPYPGGNPFSTPFAYGTIEKYYWHGTMPSGNIDEFPYAFDTYQPPFGRKPMAATETGYSTFKDGTSEQVQAKYMPRLVCEYFRKGVARTYSYELVDEFEDTARANREANFGLLHHDLTPKPAFIALRNLVRLLDDLDAKPPFRTGDLPISIEPRPVEEYRRTQYIHHLLLQKSDGTYYLLLWHEIANEDASKAPHRVITPPDIPATITFGVPLRRAQVYSYDSAWNLTPSLVTFENNTLPVSVTDRVMVIRLTPPLRG